MENVSKKTNFAELVGELNGGAVETMLNTALSTVAAAVVTHGKKGKVTLTIDLSQIGESNQVSAGSTLKYSCPTKRGSKSEDYCVDTPLYVGAGGVMTISPPEQMDMLKERREAA